MPKVVRKHFTLGDACPCAQQLHFLPYLNAADGPPASRYEYGPRRDLLLLDVSEQFFSELGNNENAAVLPFAVDEHLPPSQGFHRDELQFAHADPRSANGLDDQVQTLVMPLLRRLKQAQIFSM